MSGAAKKRINKERQQHADAPATPRSGSSSGEISSAEKSSRSEAVSARHDGNVDPAEPHANRDPNTSRPAVTEVKNLDLGAGAFTLMRGGDLITLPAQPKPSTLGQGVKVGLNTWEVGALPSNIKVFQYEVLIGSGAEKRGLIKKVWASQAVKKALGSGWIFDGNRLAWSMKQVDREQRLLVDLDQEENRTPKNGKENKHRVAIRLTNQVGLEQLEAYLGGKCDWGNACLEAINFLDHMLRETPSARYTQIKRSFFARGEQRFDLGNGVEAFKGVYQSLRPSRIGSGARLSINVDVANGTFWSESMLHTAVQKLIGARDIGDLESKLKAGEKGRAAQDLKKMRKVHVVAKHRNGELDQYCIERFVFINARDHKFEKDGKMISVYDYFAREFNIRLQFPGLPLVKMIKGKNTLLPMEVLKITENQRYQYKMDERQTSNMIKFAVTAPPERWQAIEHGLKMLDWNNDPTMKAFNVKVNPSRTIADARVLQAPKVQFGQGDAKPGTSGRWDLKGKKFLEPNPVSLKAWSVCVIAGRRGGKPDKSAVQNFITQFCNIYASHGGKIENKQPAMTLAGGDDVGAWVTAAWNAAGNQSNARPQMLVFILPDKDSITYGKIKRSAECRYGVVSQCMQYAHVQKAQGQYISNVCMKFNAKLGGSTSRAMGAKTSGAMGQFVTPTLIIGADVSHAAPGAQNPSMAAITMSMDKLGIRYAAACETNGYRVEMITTDNISSMMKPLLQKWTQNVGGGKWPSRIMYFRDGVSEGQYQHVLQQEVQDMKALIKTANPALDIPFVVLVGSKRHHVRFFPEKGDRNGNPLPGTLVESGVTHPREWDFYLNSHAAIKGTARPMHYQVLLNEAKMSPEELHTLIYEHCYQYIRATTPISQHPAIYYAHIASNRAVPHDPKWSGSSDSTPTQAPAARERSGSGSGSHGRSGSNSSAPAEFEKLMPMPNQGGIQTSMWFV